MFTSQEEVTNPQKSLVKMLTPEGEKNLYPMVHQLSQRDQHTTVTVLVARDSEGIVYTGSTESEATSFALVPRTLYVFEGDNFSRLKFSVQGSAKNVQAQPPVVCENFSEDHAPIGPSVYTNYFDERLAALSSNESFASPPYTRAVIFLIRAFLKHHREEQLCTDAEMRQFLAQDRPPYGVLFKHGLAVLTGVALFVIPFLPKAAADPQDSPEQIKTCETAIDNAQSHLAWAAFLLMAMVPGLWTSAIRVFKKGAYRDPERAEGLSLVEYLAMKRPSGLSDASYLKITELRKAVEENSDPEKNIPLTVSLLLLTLNEKEIGGEGFAKKLYKAPQLPRLNLVLQGLQAGTMLALSSILLSGVGVKGSLEGESEFWRDWIPPLLNRILPAQMISLALVPYGLQWISGKISERNAKNCHAFQAMFNGTRTDNDDDGELVIN